MHENSLYASLLLPCQLFFLLKYHTTMNIYLLSSGVFHLLNLKRTFKFKLVYEGMLVEQF